MEVVKVKLLSGVTDSLRPHGLEPTRLLPPWDSPGNSTGVGCQFPSPGDLPDPGIDPGRCFNLCKTAGIQGLVSSEQTRRVTDWRRERR